MLNWASAEETRVQTEKKQDGLKSARILRQWKVERRWYPVHRMVLGVLDSYCSSARSRSRGSLMRCGGGHEVNVIEGCSRTCPPNLSCSSRTPHGSYIDRILMMLS